MPVTHTDIQKQERFSWKKPWAFNDIHEMRKYITEREVYRKLKILERHSSFKKPYWNFGSHPHGELKYSWPGFPAHERMPPWSPPDGPIEVPSGCEIACIGGILNCKTGGCDDITCICGFPFYEVIIIEDPTGGQATVVNGDRPQVCIPKDIVLDPSTYPVIVAEVNDGIGQRTLVEFPLVDCLDCCEDFTLTGADTVNPGATWSGTVDPRCVNATAEAEDSCGNPVAVTFADGVNVSFTAGGAQCGQIKVTVTQTDEKGCNVFIATKGVRINNTGQGGGYGDQTNCCNNTPFCNTCCGVSDACSVGGCDGPRVAGAAVTIEVDGVWYRLGLGGGGDPDCSDPIYCRPCDTTGFPNKGCTPFHGCTGSCATSYEYQWLYSVCTWSCACP